MSDKDAARKLRDHINSNIAARKEQPVSRFENREEQREANRQERIKLGLHPKTGSQSLADARRALMTWTKADLVEFYLREESDAIKAVDRAVVAETALRAHRAEAITLNKPAPHHTPTDLAMNAAWEFWVHPHRGRNLHAQTVFAAGWAAHVAEGTEHE